MIVKGYREPRWNTARFDIEPGPRGLTWSAAWSWLQGRGAGNVARLLRRALDEGQVDTDE